MLQASNRVHGGTLVGAHGSKSSENFGLFTSGGQISSLKLKKLCKLEESLMQVQ